MIRTLKEIIAEAKTYLKDDFVLEDIYWIIEETLGLQKYEIFSKANESFEDVLILERVKAAVNKPVAYILNRTNFFSYSFKVTEDTLIPRNETEELIVLTLKRIEKEPNKDWTILDIGTGTGCIAITLDKELTKRHINHKIIAIDISYKALLVAKENADNLSANVDFYLSDVYDNVELGKIDLVISNPPYINKNTFVAKRVLDNEPHIALFAEENGLAIYRKIIKDLNKYNVIEAFFEISPDLVEGLENINREYLINYECKFINDMNDFIRFMNISIKK